MAISRITSQDARGTSTTSSVTATYSGSTTAGNLLIATIFTNATASDGSTISGWTKLTNNFNGVIPTMAMFYKLADGTETTITATGGNTVYRLHIYEYTGNANPIVVDTSNTGSSAAATSTTSASITTTNADDLLFASFTNSVAVTSPSFTAPFNLRQVDVTIRLWDGDQIVSSTGTYSAASSWTTSASTKNIIAAFQAAGAGGTPASSNLLTMGIS